MLEDVERGPLGAWAYNTRDSLGLSVEQVAEALPSKPHPATLRKLEGRNGRAGRVLIRELDALYRATAREKNLSVSGPPVGGKPVVDQSDVAAAIDRQTEVMRLLVEELRTSRNEPPAWVDALVAALGASPAALGTEASGGRPESDVPQRGRG